RADAAGTRADAGRCGRARAGRPAHAPLGQVRGLRRADRRPSLLGRDLDRAVRPLGRRAAGDGPARLDRASAAGRDREPRFSARRELLRRARGRSRVPALHPAGRLPRVARAGRAPLGRPRPDRALAAGAEPRAERPVSDPYEVLGVSRDATREQIVLAYLRLVAADGDVEGDRAAEIHDAYELLTDPERRAAYDAAAGPVETTAEEQAEPAVPPPPSRNPIERLTRNLPRGTRIALDWVVTIVGAVAIVLAIKAWVINPY